ncbi:MAG TPA: hypothetical protein GX513_14220 [Firmicutes bacterium]|nr:hypothetical protein [Bacillota bacterium]
MKSLFSVRYRWYLAATLTIAAVVAGVLVFGPHLPWGGARPSPDRESAVLGAGATVVYRTTYSVCGSTEETVQPAWPELIGKGAPEILARHPGWELAGFSAHQVVLQRTIEAMCPDMVRYRFLALADGRVVIYYGRTRDHLLLKEVSPIREVDLLPEDRHLLEKGVVLEGDLAVTQFLEGLEE